MREWRIGDYRIGLRIGLGTPFWFWYRPHLAPPLEGRRVAVMVPGLQMFVDHYPGAPDWWGGMDKGEILEATARVVVTDLDAQMVGLEP